MGAMRMRTPRRGPTVATARGSPRAPPTDRGSGSEELPAELTAAGESLLHALDAAGAGPDMAFWLWFRDIAEWRLVLGGGRLVRHGPQIAQSRIRRLLAESPRFDPLTMALIGIPRRGARVTETMRSALRTGPGIHGVRLHDNVLNGVRVQRAYIYRIA